MREVQKKRIEFALKLLALFSLVLFSFIGKSSSVDAVEVSFQDGVYPDATYDGTRDVEIDSRDPDKPMGREGDLSMNGEAHDPPRYVIIKWDISAIPAGSTVTSASFTWTTCSNVSPDTFFIYEMKKNWTEGIRDEFEGIVPGTGATWNTYDGVNPWGTPGATNTTDDPDRGTTILATVYGPLNYTTYTFDLNADGVNLVQSWVNSPGTNYGITIQNVAAADTLHVYSREGKGGQGELNFPKLTVCYNLPDTTPPAAITDLSASRGNYPGQINLTWTAPGDDGDTGTAASYVVKYSTSPITDQTDFDNATTYAQSWVPLPAGSTENKTLTGLSEGTYYIAIEAKDEADNQASLSNVVSIALKWFLNMVEMPWHQNEQPYYTGAATCKMILDYIIEGANAQEGSSLPLPTQDEIYNYAKGTPDGLDLTPGQVDKALGYFDPYDSLVSNYYDWYDTLFGGNPYQGYNYDVDSYNAANPDALNAYMRDICHWMAFTVTKECWWWRGALVARPNTPAAVPIFGDSQGYTHWVAVKGASTSNSPAPNPLSNPWYTPDFTIYGFWMKDPQVLGIGENKYATADECTSTYFKPLTTSDRYNGMYLQVAEPPLEMSTANVEIAVPIPNYDTLELVKLAQKDQRLIYATPSSNGTTEESTYLMFRKKDLYWRDIVDSFLLADPEAVEAFEGSFPGKPILVQRLDISNKDYYLIPYYKEIESEGALLRLTSAVIILDAKAGYFKEASWVKEPIAYSLISKEKAIQLLKRHLKGQFNHKSIEAYLSWAPSQYSPTPYKPFWKIIIADNIWYITQEGEVFAID